MATNPPVAAQGDAVPGGSSPASQPDQKVTPEPVKSNESDGLGRLVVLTSGIAILMYLQIFNTYKYFHKRHPRIFKKPKLPPFEVMKKRVLNSKLANKLRQMGSKPQGAEAKPAAAKPDGAANYSSLVNQGYVDGNNQQTNLRDRDNQQGSVFSKASTAPRLRTARRANWTDRVRKLNRLTRANNAA